MMLLKWGIEQIDIFLIDVHVTFIWATAKHLPKPKFIEKSEGNIQIPKLQQPH